MFATDAKFVIEGAGFTGATSEGEGGGFVVGDTSINKIEVYLTLETLQGDADAAAEGWKITEVIKPVEVDVATEEKPEINIDDIISEGKKDGEITISGNPTAMKTILIGSRAFEGCTNLRLKLNNSTNITYIIASDAFSEGAQIWYGSTEATNLLINANTTGKTAGQANAWVVAEPNLKVFLPTSVTQNSTNTSYGKYQYEDDQGTWYFDLIDSDGYTVTLSATNNMSVSTLSTSTYANSNTYTARLKKFKPKDGVTKVVIPKFIGISQESNKYAVTELYNTFYSCRGLTSITIPNSVTSIGNNAFLDCYYLTSIDIPNSVTSIGDNVFWGCRSLTSITVDSDNNVYHSAGNCLIETTSKTLIAGCDNSVIPNDDSVTSIGNSAFTSCSYLTSIIIPDSVTSIGSQAFRECSRLKSIGIGAGIQEVSWLPEPDNVSERTITISENNPYLATDGKAIFAKSNGELSVSKYISAETTYDIPSAVNGLSVTSIGAYAFQNCEGLTSITIPNSLTSIGKYAFSSCSGLTTITIPDKVTSIGEQAFANCSGLTSITIPEKVTSIGDQAFMYCSSLESVIIGNGVTSIGFWAFESCSGLKSIDIGAGIQEVSWLPRNVSKITITISKDNPYLATDSKAIFVKSNGKLSLSKYISTDTTYDIPAAVNDIPVTSIGDDAFMNCSGLTSITIPSSITSIGYRAFNGCSGLTAITIPDSVTSIEFGAFYGCARLTSVVIKGNITGIPDSCFGNCSNLTSIVLPASVTTIKNGAFSGCSKLTTIYVESTSNATAITDLGFAKVDDTLYDENGIENASGKYHKYTSTTA